MRIRRKACWAAIVIAANLSGGLASGASYHWNVANGTWNNSANWSPQGLPGSADSASVDHSGGGTAHVTTNVGSISDAEVSADNTLSVEFNSLNNAVLGANFLGVGENGSAGTLNISGPDPIHFHGVGVVNASQVDVGVGSGGGVISVGTVNQSGGTVTIASQLTLGASGQSLGVYHLNNGVLTSPNVKVGNGSSINNSIGSMTISGGASATLGLLQLITGNVTQTNGTVSVNSLLVSAEFVSGLYDMQGGTLASTSTLVRDNASISYSGGTLSLGALAMGQGSQIRLSSGGSKVLRTTSLSIGTVSTNSYDGGIDLSDNAMIVDYSGTSQLGNVASLIHFATWDSFTNHSTGLISSNALINDGPHKTALGYGEASALGVSSFMGQPVDGTAVLVRYTLVGDANLDGAVNALDFNAIASNYGAAGKSWTQGDFNSDAITNTKDFTALALNFGQSLAGPALGTSVPEPGIALVVPLLGLLRRRRHRI